MMPGTPGRQAGRQAGRRRWQCIRHDLRRYNIRPHLLLAELPADGAGLLGPEVQGQEGLALLVLGVLSNLGAQGVDLVLPVHGVHAGNGLAHDLAAGYRGGEWKFSMGSG